MDGIWALDTPHIIRIGETRFRKDGIPSSLFEGHEHKQRCICNIVCLFQSGRLLVSRKCKKAGRMCLQCVSEVGMINTPAAHPWM